MRVITTIVALGFAAVSMAGNAQAEDAYKFTVANKTGTKIVKLLTSLDGSNWQGFNLGDGIASQASSVIEWADHTDDSDCELPLKAVYSDGSESVVKKYDFCAEDLTINFVE